MTGDMAGIAGRSAVLGRLVERVRSVEAGVCGLGDPCEGRDRFERVRTGWDVFDRRLGGGLSRGRVHEWFGVCGMVGEQRWAPPLAVLSHCVERSLERGIAIWFGRSVWPYAQLLPNRVRRYSLFVDIGDRSSCRNSVFVWALDMALRCRSISTVVADGRGLSMAASRRLQLAAESGGCLCLLARSSDEVDALSAASTRWRVSWCQSHSYFPRWRIELLRIKNRGFGTDSTGQASECVVEGFRDEAHGLRVVA